MNPIKNTLKYGVLILFVLIGSLQIHAQLASGQSKFLGNTHTQGQTPLNFDMYWNQITPGNAGKWASCEQNRDDFNYWLWYDRAYDHAKQNNFVFKEHTLIWGHSSGEPAWMSSVPQDEQMDEVIEWFEAVAERFPNNDLIDVVNEPLHAPPSYTAALGGAGESGWDWVIWSFEKAREIFPNSTLILNDYNILNYTNECQNFLVIIKLLQDRGLIDGIGLQAHSLESISFSTIQTNMELLAATGLDIYISEYEARGDDATQLALFKEQFTYFWEHPSVKGVTLWGYLQGDMWRAEAYLLAADGITERPALQWLREYFNYYPENVQYTFVTNTSGNGSISLNPSGGTYNPFTNVVATAIAADGYEFSHWTGDKGGSVNPTTMAMTSNRSLTANFVEVGFVEQYTLSVSASVGGTVSQSPTGTIFDEGTVISLTATANSGFKFDGWSGSSSSSSTTISITMDGNKSLTANFSELGGSGCDSEIAISMPYTQNGEGEYCFVASGIVNYINSWNMDYLEVNGKDITNTWSNSFPVAEDGKIHIHYLSSVGWSHFEINGTDGGTTTNYDLTTLTVGQGSITPSTGSFAEGSSVTITATPAVGWAFSSWSGDASGTSTSTSITMNSDKSVTATFIEIINPIDYDLTITVVGQGSVSPASGTYIEGTLVSLTATPASGWVFSSWSGDASGTSASSSLTMDSDKSVTATFTEVISGDCNFGTPIATALPSLNATYKNIHVLGSAGPDLSNVTNLTINWDLSNNGLWQFSMNTSNGQPDWYKDLKSNATQTFNNAQPMLTLSGSGFNGLDGTYYVAADAGNFVMVETSGTYTIYCSNSSESPACIGLKEALATQSGISNNSFKISPNPVSNVLNITNSDSEIIKSIKIYNALGQIIHYQTNLNVDSDYSIRFEGAAGLYFIQITTDKSIHTEQILKN